MLASKIKIHPSISPSISLLRHFNLIQKSSFTISSEASLNRINQKDWLSPNEVLKILQPIKNPNTIISAFKTLSDRKDHKPTSSLYLLLINNLALTQNFDAIEGILGKLKIEKSFKLSDEFFYEVIRVYGHVGGRINDAIKTLFDMPGYNVWPSIKTFNFVLNLLVSTKNFEVVRVVFVGSSKLGIEIDACSLNILIKGLCAYGDLEGAFKVLDEFPKQRCLPNEKTFSTLMKGLCKHGKVDEALKLFDKMENEQIEPDTITFNILISGFRKCRRIDEGIGVLERMMMLKGCCPNAGSYQEVVYGLLEVDRFLEAKAFMWTMVRKGMCPSFVSYKLIINGLCKEKLVEDAYSILKQMVEQGFVPKMGMWKQIVHSSFSGNGTSSFHYLGFFEDVIRNEPS